VTVPVLRADLRPFGDCLPDRFFTEHQVDTTLIQLAGETRPTTDTERGAAAVVVFLGAREAERQFPNLRGVHYAGGLPAELPRSPVTMRGWVGRKPR
jgi:hypothetical protein